jgi:hypothetical protein
MKRKSLKRLIGKPVHVDWADAVSMRGWHSVEALECESIDVAACGFLVSATKDRIVLAIGDDLADEKCSALIVPRGMVKRIKRLNVKRKRKGKKK